MRDEIVPGLRAVELDLAERTFAHGTPRLEIGTREGHDEDDCNHGAAGQRAHDRPEFGASRPNQERDPDRNQVCREEDAVVERRKRLERQKEACEQAVSKPSGRDRPVEGPQAERHPLRHLQLEMRVVHVAVRQEGEHESCDERRRGVLRQRADQQEHRRARQRKSGEQQKVVGEDLMDAQPQERRHRQRRDDHRIRESERVLLRIEDVPVEQMQGVPGKLVCDP